MCGELLSVALSKRHLVVREHDEFVCAVQSEPHCSAQTVLFSESMEIFSRFSQNDVLKDAKEAVCIAGMFEASFYHKDNTKKSSTAYLARSLFCEQESN